MNIEALKTLNGFTGTEHYYSYLGGLKLTDGVKFLADNADSYWLLDAIASYQGAAKKDPMLREMQFWTLKTDVRKGTAVLTCERDSGNVAFTQEIPFTDFPLPEIKVWVSNDVALLPSEY
jgi:hypothetical protein